jgi:hypothetical protein
VFPASDAAAGGAREGAMVLRTVLWGYGVMVLLGLYSGAVQL